MTSAKQHDERLCDMDYAEFSVGGMHCPNCAGEIARHLSRIEGIGRVRVDAYDGLASVEYNGALTQPHEIATAITALGYTVHSSGQQ